MCYRKLKNRVRPLVITQTNKIKGVRVGGWGSDAGVRALRNFSTPPNIGSDLPFIDLKTVFASLSTGCRCSKNAALLFFHSS